MHFNLTHKEQTNKAINFLQNQMHSIILLLCRNEEFQYELIWGGAWRAKGKDLKLSCFSSFSLPFMHFNLLLQRVLIVMGLLC